MKKCYKVVRNVGGRLYSAMMASPDLLVEYSTDNWAVPKLKKSKLMAFKNYETARGFAEGLGRYMDHQLEVYECDVKGPKVMSMGCDLDTVKAFWAATPKSREDFPLLPLPSGTVCATSIKLGKNVYTWFVVDEIKRLENPKKKGG